jgi:hypothetical protein
VAYQSQALDGTEPISDTSWEISANQQLYGVMDGCAVTYDAANLTFDVAAGHIMHSGDIVAVAAQTNADTIVVDGSNPRFTWIRVNSSGVVDIVSGTAGSDPVVPELGDYVALALLRPVNGDTVANDIVAKIDKRVPVKWMGFKGTDIASASTINFPVGGGSYYDITGTTTITAIGAATAGTEITFQFDGVLTITHHATSMIMVAGVSLTTAAGMVVTFISEGSGNWREKNTAHTVASHSDTTATGANLTTLTNASETALHSHAAAATSGWTRVGGSTTEATTTSATAVSLITVGSLSIPAATPIFITFNYRKTSGSGTRCAAGLQLNSTVVFEANVSDTIWHSATSQAEDGFCWMYIPPTVTNYTTGFGLGTVARTTAVGSVGIVTAGTSFPQGGDIQTTNVRPSATITDVVIRGESGFWAMTFAVDEVHIYTWGAS